MAKCPTVITPVTPWMIFALLWSKSQHRSPVTVGFTLQESLCTLVLPDCFSYPSLFNIKVFVKPYHLSTSNYQWRKFYITMLNNGHHPGSESHWAMVEQLCTDTGTIKLFLCNVHCTVVSVETQVFVTSLPCHKNAICSLKICSPGLS